MKTRVSLHHFESDPGLAQRDGVNLAHTEINHLLETEAPPGLDVAFHDFSRLVQDPGYARAALDGVDCVLSNVGPHAHYYHHLREKLGLGFRIVRDIKTALWSSYLLQECLCAPYLRPGDALLATSNYSRVLTRHLFPHLRGQAIHLFEPVLASAAERRQRGEEAPHHARPVTLGYVGRLSEDKNFPQVVDLLIALDREEPGGYRLVACGAVHSPSCDPVICAERIKAETGRDDLFAYLEPLAHDEVVPLMRTFDYLLFLSTSNLEVLGRVIIEAAHAGVPVLASNHAAAAELLSPSSLVDVAYKLDQPFFSHFDAPMGVADIAAAVDIIRRRAPPSAPPPEARVNRAESFMAILLGHVPVSVGSEPLGKAQQRFLKRLRWDGLDAFSSIAEANVAIDEMLDWFCALNGRGGEDFPNRLRNLELRSRFRERTRRFIEQSERTRCDFTNLGGIDIELCNVVRFHPSFSLSDEARQDKPHGSGPFLERATDSLLVHGRSLRQR